MLLADVLWRRAFLAARLRRLAVLEDKLLVLRILLTPRLFVTRPLKDLFRYSPFFVLARARLLTLPDNALPDRLPLSTMLLLREYLLEVVLDLLRALLARAFCERTLTFAGRLADD